MKRFLSNLASFFLGATESKPSKPIVRRARLGVESMEERMVLSTATLAPAKELFASALVSHMKHEMEIFAPKLSKIESEAMPKLNGKQRNGPTIKVSQVLESKAAGKQAANARQGLKSEFSKNAAEVSKQSPASEAKSSGEIVKKVELPIQVKKSSSKVAQIPKKVSQPAKSIFAGTTGHGHKGWYRSY
jgi:hypothetical protein